MAGPSVFFLYNLTARAQDIGILSISNPSKEVIALKHFSLPRGLVPLLALALVVSMATPASAFFWQKKENTPAGVADFSKNTLAGGSVTFSQEDFRSSDLSSITLTALPDPKAGVLTVGGQPLTQGAVVDASALSGLTFQSLPTPGVSTASFTFLPAFADGTSAGKETTVTLYLLDEANDPPIARNMELSTYQNIAVTGYFDAVDGEGDTLTFQLTSTPARGAVELAEDGSARFVYTPYENKTGKDSFTYVALDQAGNTSPEAKVTLCIEKPDTKVTYADLEGSAAHKAAIRLAEEGILVGESHGGRYFFQPEQTVSRAEFLALAMDAAGLEPMEDVTVTGFSDDEAIPTWAKGSVSSALKAGVIQGERAPTGAPVFSAGTDITCGEATVMLDRLLNMADVPLEAAGLSVQGHWAGQAAANLAASGVLAPDQSTSAALSEPLTRAAAAERERQEKEEEKRRKEEARLERQRRLEEEKKNRGKKHVKKDEPTEPGVNKDDSRIGIRAYARGRAYIPERFGGVTEYRDMSDLLQAEIDAEQQKKGKKNKKAAPAQEKKEETAQKPETEALPKQETAPAEQPAVQQSAPETPEEQPAPVQEPAETEEVEVEVEQIEVELPEEEDDKKEGV